MARPRRTTPDPRRIASMRKNSRNLGQNQPFQGGIGQGPGIAPKGPMPNPSRGQQQCPAGQEPGPMPDGRMGCVPEKANIAGNVPVVNSQRAINPGPASNPGAKKPRGY